MALIEALERSDDFTKLESDIANYVLAHGDDVIGLSVGELAQRTYASTATVIRLCHKVGVSGYRDFRLQLASELERRRSVRKDTDVNKPFDGEDDVRSIVSAVANVCREALDVCHAAIDIREVVAVAKKIADAPHVAIFAHGDTRITALGFVHMLSNLGILAYVAGQPGEPRSVARALTRGDLVILVSYTGGLLEELRDELVLFKERGVTTVLVSSAKEPLGIDHALSFPAYEARMSKVATYYSQTCIRFVLDCLYAEIFAHDFEANLRRRDEGEPRGYGEIDGIRPS